MNKPFTLVYFWRQSNLGVSEGLNVLFSDLIGGLLQNGTPVRVITTRRHIKGLLKTLDKNCIPTADLEITPLITGSVFLAFKDFFAQRKRIKAKKTRKYKKLNILISIQRGYERVIAWLLSLHLHAAPIKFLLLILLFVIGIVATLLAFTFFAIYKIIWKTGIGSKLSSLFLRGINILKAVFNRIISLEIVELVYMHESAKLAAVIDRNKDISTIFIPTAFEGYLCRSVKVKRKLIVFPDATPLLFPTRFPGSKLSDFLLNSMRQSVENADGIVCYSKFVRDKQLLQFFSRHLKKTPVKVIPQGFYVAANTGERVTFSNEELNRYIKNFFPEYGELPKAYFGEFVGIIYPTVDRPHKNTITLIKGVESLLRERGRNVKLLLTSPGATSEVISYIRKKKLHRDVLFMPELPISVLTYLIGQSAIMVHPSLAEGGDIFNFSRAVSEGTPALIADIPVVREMFERHGYDESIYGKWLFKGTNVEVLTEKMDQILNKSWDPLSGQALTLSKLSSYRFSNMADDYYSFYNNIDKIYSENTNNKKLLNHD